MTGTFSGPGRAEITRQRTVRSTGGKYGKRGKSDAKNLSLHDRVAQFPNENLTTRESKLFCSACKERVSTKKSILRNHINSKKHNTGKGKLSKSKLRERSIIEVFQASENKQVQDSTLPMNERAFRVEVLEDFLKTSVPVYKVDKLRPLLEKHGYRLTHSTNLRQYIPLIMQKEVDQLKREIASPSCDHDTRDLSLIFDGSTRQGEEIVITVRFLDDDWSIQQRLIKRDICEKAVNTEGMAHVLNDCL